MQTEKQRERLVELLNEATFGVNVHTLADHLSRETIDRVAEYLMANGVIVPPCSLKVGDKVYRKMCRGFNKFYLREETVWIVDMHFTAGLEIITKYVEPKGITLFPKIDIEDIGKTVFLSRAEAENVLKERNNAD
jgi:hypothetical protein